MYDAGKSEWYSLGANKLHARKWGSGAALFVCLHGYSNNSSMFAGLHTLLGNDWTVIAFDLPGHGQTEWTEPFPITSPDLRKFMQELCAAHDVEKLSVLGFSLGGRFALSMLAAAPEFIHKMVLAAPDGLSTNPVYRLTNGSWAGQKLFRTILQKPQRFAQLIDVLVRRKVLSAQRAQFFKYHLSSPASNRLLSSIWVAMGKMYPTKAQLVRVLNRHRVPVHLLMGVADAVIPIVLGERFQAACPQWITLHRLQKHHRILDGEGMQMAVNLLKS